MLPSIYRTEPRSIEEITALIEAYPERWRRWCSSPENGGCACMGCVRQPSPSTVRGDPEYARWPNEANALIEEEVKMYHALHPSPRPLVKVNLVTVWKKPPAEDPLKDTE